ncbi:MAG: xanthine dehydrogenase YagR molybdenum-binding subunit, partial [Mycobacterium sp.]|nr:xanthine dehydrogenase YagR molybdenum-binding subunit [Mycobacterium sp.]
MNIVSAALVQVRYCAAPQPLTDIDAPQAVPEPGQNERVKDYARGDADAALRSAAVTTDLQYSIARNNHNPMELPATVARLDGDQLTVWDKVQGITWALEAYSKAFGIPKERVRIISPFVGGAFGSARKTADASSDQTGVVPQAVLLRGRIPPDQPAADGHRRRPSGRISTIVHEARVENSRYDGYEDNLTGVARFQYSSPNMRSTYRTV